MQSIAKMGSSSDVRLIYEHLHNMTPSLHKDTAHLFGNGVLIVLGKRHRLLDIS